MQNLVSGLKTILRIIGALCATVLCGVLFLLAQVVLSGVIYDLPFAGWVCLAATSAWVAVIVIYIRRRSRFVAAAWILLTLLACVAAAAWLRYTTIGPAMLALGVGAAPGTFVIFGGFGMVLTLICAWRKAWRTVCVAGVLSSHNQSMLEFISLPPSSDQYERFCPLHILPHPRRTSGRAPAHRLPQGGDEAVPLAQTR